MKTLFSILLLLLCVSSQAQFVFTNVDNNATFNLEPGQQQDISFQLTQNGGTAYQWKLVKHNEAVCKFLKEDTVPVEQKGEKLMAGAPVIRQFHFKSTGKAGACPVKIQLVSFSGEVAQEFNFMIKMPYQQKKRK